MKKMYMYLIAVLLLGLSLAACKKDPPAQETQPSTAATDTAPIATENDTSTVEPDSETVSGEVESDTHTPETQPTEEITMPETWFDDSIFSFDKPDMYDGFHGAGDGEVNVKNHGAVGDGKTDDAAALVAAVAAAGQGNRMIYFPKGTYLLQTAVSLSAEGGVDCIAFEEGAVLINEGGITLNAYVMAGNGCVFSGSGAYTGSIRNAHTNPMWFGACGDGKTDDSAAFVSALGVSSSIVIPYSEAGYVLGDIPLTKTARVSGADTGTEVRTRLIGKPGAVHLFRLKANGLIFENFDVDMSEAGEADVFFFDTSESGRDDIRLENIHVQGAYCVIKDAAVVTNYVTNMLADNVNCTASRGTVFDMKCFWGFIFFRDLTIDVSKTEELFGVQPNFPLVNLENNAGCIFQRVTLIGDGLANAQGVGFRYTNNVAVWMDECTFIDLSSSCVKVDNSSHLYFSNLRAEGCMDHAFKMTKVSYLQMHAISISGSTAENKSGILLNNCSDTQLTNCAIDNVTGHGINLARCTGTSIVGCQITHAGGAGISNASSVGTVAVSCSFAENAEGDSNLTEGKEIFP